MTWIIVICILLAVAPFFNRNDAYYVRQGSEALSILAIGVLLGLGFYHLTS